MNFDPGCPNSATAKPAYANRSRPSTPSSPTGKIYLTLADNVENFLTGLKNKAATANVAERQRVLRLLVKDVLVSPDKITIRHSIPVRHKPTSLPDTDQEGESSPNCQLRWRSQDAALRGARVSVPDSRDQSR